MAEATAIAYPSRRLPVMRDARPALRLAPAPAASLADVIRTAWAGIQAQAPVACPMCDGRMEPRLCASGVAGGRCRDCGSELS